MTETMPLWTAADERLLRAGVVELGDVLIEVSRSIHRHPETRFEEFFASELLARQLEDDGFAVEAPFAGMETAFRAGWDSGRAGPTVAIFCEYDALPGIGHGCGHNVIAASGLGAALLLTRLFRSDESLGGRILVLGSPGEEGGGGKIPIIRTGVLDGVAAALMVHPGGENLAAMRTLSRASLTFTFTGRAAHAAVRPEDGINALDAAVLTLTAIGLLRQQTPDGTRIHAILTEGGTAPNVIPERAVVTSSARCEDPDYLLDRLAPRLIDCARGAAMATGAEVDVDQSLPYLSLRPDPLLDRVVAAAYRCIGREPEPRLEGVFPGSTDMGNVSQVAPSIHPTIEIKPGLTMHSREAEELVGGEAGDRAVLDGALMLALTAAAVLRRPEIAQELVASFVPGLQV